MTRLMPGGPVPDLEVALAGGGTWNLSDQTPATFTVVEVYRGRHCPRCKLHLLDMDHKVARYAERGCTSIVISTDPQDRAEKSVSEWDIHQLPIGYGMTTDQARLGPVYF
jgi:peroxiredoxin